MSYITGGLKRKICHTIAGLIQHFVRPECDCGQPGADDADYRRPESVFDRCTITGVMAFSILLLTALFASSRLRLGQWRYCTAALVGARGQFVLVGANNEPYHRHWHTSIDLVRHTRDSLSQEGKRLPMVNRFWLAVLCPINANNSVIRLVFVFAEKRAYHQPELLNVDGRAFCRSVFGMKINISIGSLMK